MFEVKQVTGEETDEQIKRRMHDKDALIAVIVPSNFSEKIISKAEATAAKALNNFGLDQDSSKTKVTACRAHYALLPSCFTGIFPAIDTGVVIWRIAIGENKQVLKSLYLSLNDKAIPEELENEIIQNQVPITRNSGFERRKPKYP